MVDSVKQSVIQKVEVSQHFAFQLNETTDITNFVQLLVYIRLELEISFNE